MKPVWQRIHHMGNTHALVENRKGDVYMVAIERKHCKHAVAGDDALVVKSAVTHRWYMIDYSSNQVDEEEIESGFHDSFQTALQAGDIYD